MTTYKQGEQAEAERAGRVWDESGTASPLDNEPREPGKCDHLIAVRREH